MGILAVLDRIFETTVTAGVGTYTLAGAQVGFQAFAAAGANNYVTYYATDDTNWELGWGTVLAGPARLTRDTIIASSNGGAAVNWGGGTVKLRCGMPAELAFPRALSKAVGGGVDVALTVDEQRRQIIKLTGVLTANINVTVDATPWGWTLLDSTTGNYSVTFKVTGQAGFKLPRGRYVHAICDGTDVRRGGAALGWSFGAYRSTNQTMTVSVYNRVNFDTVEFNVGGYYDNVTNYCVTPPAGKALLGGVANIASGGDQNLILLALYKNGSLFKILAEYYMSGASGGFISGSAVVDCNGTDYFDLRLLQATGIDRTLTGTQDKAFFFGHAVSEGSGA